MDSAGAAERPYVEPSRSRHYVSDSVEWSAVRRTSRTRPTVTTFGWRGKLVLSVLPHVVFLAWASAWSGLGAALLLGMPLFALTPFWLKHVWAAGPVECTREELRRAVDTTSAPYLPPPDRASAHPNLAYLHEAPAPDA
ncbi:hypothetical protein CLV92_11140 [Kineococcus xinjiangensis]|uniref:Uncharacterized protein n=1 Tax=Kineococcus xinjiangensis TaxID=512762 RepID=A0A2S6IFZ2_9ACTN|nr:hypothetical protein [Kineococcus xinjiangensis]PPK93123.1 hypothetical protein CLV92_11140 [Kineococcus xinjiangensis]